MDVGNEVLASLRLECVPIICNAITLRFLAHSAAYHIPPFEANAWRATVGSAIGWVRQSAKFILCIVKVFTTVLQSEARGRGRNYLLLHSLTGGHLIPFANLQT